MTRWQQLRDWASRALSHPGGQGAALPVSNPDQRPVGTAAEVVLAYRTLLVPLDGSLLAECALPFARRLATLAGAGLVLVRTVAEGESAAAQAAATAYLEAHADALRESGLRVEAIVPTGAAVEAIAATIEAREADLVVMTTSGRYFLGHGASGLFAGLLARVEVPILLVRDWHDAAALAPATGHGDVRIVVPLDGSTLAERALAPAQAFAALLGGELVLVRAVPTAQPSVPAAWGLTSPDWLADRAEHAEGYLRDVAAKLTAHGYAVRCEVRPGNPVAAIHGAVREHRATLLALATHGETGLPTVPLGSVARHVLWEADAPVVLVHPTLVAGSGADATLNDDTVQPSGVTVSRARPDMASLAAGARCSLPALSLPGDGE